MSHFSFHLLRVAHISLPLDNILFEDVPLVVFLYLVFTRMPGESYRRRLGSLLLCLCYVFPELINRETRVSHSQSPHCENPSPWRTVTLTVTALSTLYKACNVYKLVMLNPRQFNPNSWPLHAAPAADRGIGLGREEIGRLAFTMGVRQGVSYSKRVSSRFSDLDLPSTEGVFPCTVGCDRKFHLPFNQSSTYGNGFILRKPSGRWFRYAVCEQLDAYIYMHPATCLHYR